MSKSLQTRNKIIAAAFQQIAGEDSLHRLQLERIAEKAGVSEATIHYHFGTKEEFSKALWQNIVEQRAPYTFGHFYEQNRHLLEDREGQKEFIHQMIITICTFFRKPKNEYLRRLVRLFFMENIGVGKSIRPHVTEYVQKELDVFHQICHEICGLNSKDESSLLFLFVMHPLSISFTHAVNPQRRSGSEMTFAQYEKAVMNYAEHELLFHLGLSEPRALDRRHPIPLPSADEKKSRS